MREVTAGELVHRHADLREVVIEGFLRAGETMNIVAAPKVGKSWLAHSLALSMAAGTPWLGRNVTSGELLLIDAELHDETLGSRFKELAKTSELSAAELDRITIWPVRGEGWTIEDVQTKLETYPAKRFRLIVIDALYRFMILGEQENSNEGMTRFYNALDTIARRSGAAIVVVHHFSKGTTAGKAITDMGAGGGAQSRAADTHLVVRHHVEEDAFVVEAVTRSFPQPVSFVVRSQKPGWKLAPELDPSQIDRHSRRTAKESGKTMKQPPLNMSAKSFVDKFIGGEALIKGEILRRACVQGMSKSAAEDLLSEAESNGLVSRDTGNGRERHKFYAKPTQPQGEGEGPHDPGPPEPVALGGYGGERATPLPPPTASFGRQNAGGAR